jgi:Na+/proline symporter
VLQAGLSIASILYGALLGVFLLGLLTTRVGEIAAMCGMTASLLLMLYIGLRTPVAFTWYVLIGTATTCAVGLLVSLFLKEAMPLASK